MENLKRIDNGDLWRKALLEDDITTVQKMVEDKNEWCNFYLASEWAVSDSMRNLLKKWCSIGQMADIWGGYNMTPSFYGKEPNYAVVNWFNYRKEHSCGCNAVFEKYSDARDYMYKMAYYECMSSIYGNYRKIDKNDMFEVVRILNKGLLTCDLCPDDKNIIDSIEEKYNRCFSLISEDQITDNNGPGYSHYRSLESIGNSKDGYSTTFYCLVDHFHGVENRWNFDEGFVPVVGSSWNPQYV